MGKKLVFVKYSDCNLEVLGDCNIKGKYSYSLTSRTKIGDYIYNKDDLYSYLPFDASSLEPEFGPEGLWSLQAVIVGKYETSLSSVGRSQLKGRCADATHFIKKMDVGAYRLEVQRREGEETIRKLIKKGGAFERCFLTQTDASIPACQSILKMHLVPIAYKSALPTSDPHHLLDQLPGPERSRRVEMKHMGKSITLPCPDKVTVIAFWSEPCTPGSKRENTPEVCEGMHLNLFKKSMAKMEQLWQKSDQRKVQIVGVAIDIDANTARGMLSDLSVTFPMLIDNETGKLKKRYHVGMRLPVFFVIDDKGQVRLYADGSPGDLEKVNTTVRALTGN
ncbi:MAG: TlpA family protein disulfide reductase [Proteobacteria bacterium]|nr:TlpA family protein disulfide reductase [Pseudomonadota bacterium]